MLTADDRAALAAQLLRHEGLRLKPYLDTVGKVTIGIGRNLTDVGISRAEAFVLLEHDIATAERALDAAFPWVAELDPVRHRVLIDMGFNLGLVGLKGFPRMLEAVQHGRYALAAEHMLASKWATQVGTRAVRLARMMESGEET